MSFFENFGLNFGYVKEFIAAIGGIITFGFTVFHLGRRFGNGADRRKIEALVKDNVALTEKVDSYENRFHHLSEAIGTPQDFWSKTPDNLFNATIHQGEISTSIPIISVINFKGGVGKTTICANLAAHLACAGKRVLLIDFDYQGSLSDTVLSHARVEQFSYTSHKLIDYAETPEQVRPKAERLSSLNSNLWIYPAFYGFSRVEIQMMFRWLVGEAGDIRYNLHHHLQSPLFQSNPETQFDLILIDCPPRLLTGAVNALAASTHVLVPTILDGQSHVATLNTLGAIQQFRQKLNKNLRTLGIVPALVVKSNSYNKREIHFIKELERQITNFHDPVPVLKDRPIIKKERVASAGGSEVIYLSESYDEATVEIRAMFDKLAAYIDNKVTWKLPETTHVIAMPGAPNEGRRTATGT